MNEQTDDVKTSTHRSALLTVLTALVTVIALTSCNDSNDSDGSGGETGETITGRGGSLARMTIAGDYLYAIAGESEVQLFDITTPASPNPWNRITIDWGLETLFPYGDYLLVGAVDGLHILDNGNPGFPEYVADFTHARARDPVVARDGYAYVTLRQDGNPGGLQSNQLDVIDIRDIRNPSLVDIYPMQEPSGLAVAGDRLYVCDGIAGIKILDITDPQNLVGAGSISGVDCRDVIVREGLLTAITDDSLEQYDVSADPPRYLSSIGSDTIMAAR